MPPHSNPYIEKLLHPNPGMRSNIDYVPLYEAGVRYKRMAQLATHLLVETYTDPLTGLDNEKSFTTALEAAVERENSHDIKPGSETNIAVIKIDVDHFKTVNDTLGHNVGDKVLQLIGTAVRSGIRDADIATHAEELDEISTNVAPTTENSTQQNSSKAAHQHGDEFDILVRDIVGSTTVEMTKQKRLESMKTRLRDAVNMAMQSSEYSNELLELGVGISVGAEIYLHGESIEGFLQRTDMAMYADKAERKASSEIPRR